MAFVNTVVMILGSIGGIIDWYAKIVVLMGKNQNTPTSAYGVEGLG